MSRVWVSAGSNIRPEEHIPAAIVLLRDRFGELVLSPVYQTPAVGFDGDDFYNMVLGFETEIPVEEVRTILHLIEDQQGRVRDGVKFTSRTLDLDLLIYGNMVSEELDIPRSEITRYAFVLGPLAQVAGSEYHPVIGKSYAELWNEFDQGESMLKEVSL